MSLFLFFKVLIILILLLWYIQHKDKLFLYILLASLTSFFGDLWKLIKGFFSFSENLTFTVDNAIMVVNIAAVVVIILIGKNMIFKKNK